eukprot:Em0010g972a
MLKELKCAVCSNILSQTLELQCGALISTNVILLLLLDVLVHCTDCSRDVKAGDYHHLQEASSRIAEKIRGIVNGEASALIEKEVLILSDEERRSLLDKAGISSSIELGQLRWLKSPGICLAAGSKGHRLLGSLLWGDATTSIFWGVGPSFHAFNESRPPCLPKSNPCEPPTQRMAEKMTERKPLDHQEISMKLKTLEEFQRLHGVKQLGFLCDVYGKDITHTRLSYSIKLFQKAEQIVQQLKKNQPELNITDQDDELWRESCKLLDNIWPNIIQMDIWNCNKVELSMEDKAFVKALMRGRKRT